MIALLVAKDCGSNRVRECNQFLLLLCCKKHTSSLLSSTHSLPFLSLSLSFKNSNAIDSLSVRVHTCTRTGCRHFLFHGAGTRTLRAFVTEPCICLWSCLCVNVCVYVCAADGTGRRRSVRSTTVSTANLPLKTEHTTKTTKNPLP